MRSGSCWLFQNPTLWPLDGNTTASGCTPPLSVAPPPPLSAAPMMCNTSRTLWPRVTIPTSDVVDAPDFTVWVWLRVGRQSAGAGEWSPWEQRAATVNSGWDRHPHPQSCPPRVGGGGAGTCFNFHSGRGGDPLPPSPPAQASPWGGGGGALCVVRRLGYAGPLFQGPELPTMGS